MPYILPGELALMSFPTAADYRASSRTAAGVGAGLTFTTFDGTPGFQPEGG